MFEVSVCFRSVVMSGESLGFSPHNPKVVGSNPAPATKEVRHLANRLSAFLFGSAP